MADNTKRRKNRNKSNCSAKDFLVYRYIKWKQAEHMTKALSSYGGESILLQADLFENASLISQDENQFTHWSNNQTTLFTNRDWVNDITSDSYMS